MTCDELREKLIRLHETMTPGEWHWTDRTGSVGLCEEGIYIGEDKNDLVYAASGRGSGMLTEEDGKSFAELRNLLPELIAALTPAPAPSAS